jgi:hypothetical protein
MQSRICVLEAANAEKAERIVKAIQALDDGPNSVPEQRKAKWILTGRALVEGEE